MSLKLVVIRSWISLLLFFLLWTPNLQSNCKDHLHHLFKSTPLVSEVSDNSTSSLDTLPRIKTHFEMAPAKEQQQVLITFRQQMAHKENTRSHLEAHQVQRVSAQHLTVNLNHGLPQYTQYLRQLGNRRISELVYITSGAGLWTRGGEVVKALVPYNLAFFCSDQVIDHLRFASKILTAENHEAVIKLSGHKLAPTEDLAQISVDLVNRQKRYLQHLMRKIIYIPEAINPIDVKLVNVAIHSILNRTYIPFDIWTGQATNRAIQEYLSWREVSYGRKIFHPDAQINLKIHTILAKYFKMADTFGDRHLFAYQNSFHAIDIKKRVYDPNSAALGPGAGAFLEYYRQSGRYQRFKNMGKRYYLFDNIEIANDLALLFGAHLESDKALSVILVPERPHYKGGSPFLIQDENSGEWHLQVREMSAIPKELATHNEWFNTNTIFYDIDTLMDPGHPLAFEIKNHHTQARLKINAADPTMYFETAGIGGRLDLSFNPMVEYENFKSYDDYLRHGIAYLISFQNLWERLLTN